MDLKPTYNFMGLAYFWKINQSKTAGILIGIVQNLQISLWNIVILTMFNILIYRMRSFSFIQV